MGHNKALICLCALAAGCHAYQAPLTKLQMSAPPRLGFGTWNIDTEDASSAVSAALRTGYRHIDAAAKYGNEVEVGQGIAEALESGIPREDIWVTSKLWNDQHRPKSVATAFNKTLTDLGLDYIDLYHMHWPVAFDPDTGDVEQVDVLDTWHAMEDLVSSGRVRYIGVCNFAPHQLQHLISNARIAPYVHQMELHPYLQQIDWVGWHKDHSIHVTAYSPLGNTNPTYSDQVPRLLTHQAVTDVAKKVGCTPAQVVLAWGLSRGTSVIPKSSHNDRIVENYDSPNCALGDIDKRAIDNISQSIVKRFGNPGPNWGVDLFEGLDK